MLALKSDGTVWAWGENDQGQLGIGNSTGPNICLVGLAGQEAHYACSTSPAQVTGLSDVIAIAAGPRHNLALKKDGTVWAWGTNVEGELGIGNDTGPDHCAYIGGGDPRPCSLTPVQVSALSNVKAIAAGVVTANSLALKQDGTVWVWGSNAFGQLGSGAGPGKCGGLACDSTTPVQVKDLSNITALAGGWGRGLALRNDGTVWVWGPAVVQVSGLSNVTAIAGGQLASYALKNDGTIWAWGFNAYGDVGDGTDTDRMTPVQVKDLSRVAAIAPKMALEKDGTVWAWGLNYCGFLGNGSNSGPEDCRGYPCSRSPRQISGLSGVTAIASNECSGLALRSDGTVWAWGPNEMGELGIGTADQSHHKPVQVQGL
jgi:alpha-tubulin suppressor-like RCC1 family protein